MIKKIAVVFGGNSCEHEISIISALQVLHVLKEKYEVTPIYISKTNEFYSSDLMMDISYFNKETMFNVKDKVTLDQTGNRLVIKKKFKKVTIDMVVPIMHGTNGEDGAIQGFLSILNVPYVGNSISSSALAQSKILSKKILDVHHIPQLDYKIISNEYMNNDIYPCIIKPDHLGSSIGIQVVLNENEYKVAASKALRYDPNCIIEPYIIDFTEINCSVLKKDGKIQCSNLEEVSHNDDILSFHDKYEAANKTGNTQRNITPTLSATQEQTIYAISEEIYEAFDFSSVIRIDFMIIDNEVYVNEINSIPGSFAYYLWDMTFIELLDIEIHEAIREYMRKETLTLSFNSNVLCSSNGIKK